MAWQSGTVTGYHGLLNTVVQFATSKHVSAVAINNDGSGYTAGDLLTITHAGATQNCTIEVLTVDGTGQILTVAIRSNGAFSNRIASATVSAAGSNYAVGDVLQVQGGTSTCKGKMQVATLSGSGVATVTVFEGGGAYSVAPTSPATTTKVGPAAGTGSGCTLTLTMSGLIGTTGIAATGGTGSAATFDLTLTDTGWSVLHDRNDYSVNSVTNEKEVVLQGTVAAGDSPIVGIRSYTQTTGLNTYYGWILCGMDDFNPSLGFAGQLNQGPVVAPGNNGCFLLQFNANENYWLSVTGRRILGVRKAQGATTLTYQSFHLGLLNPFGTTTESPYPMYLSASTGVANRAPDAGNLQVSGLSELMVDIVSTLDQANSWFRHPGTGVWTKVVNLAGVVGVATTRSDHVLFPVGYVRGVSTSEDDYITTTDTETMLNVNNNTVIREEADTATRSLYPTLTTNETMLFPLTLISSPDATNTSEVTLRGEIDGGYWISIVKSDGSLMTAEDTLTVGSTRYRIFRNAHRSERYSFYAIKEA